jgi:hypothetical protein
VMLTVISLGAGVQSTTMALMAAHGEIGPMPDCAIFADTGWEPPHVYEHLKWLSSANVLPFPVHVVSKGRTVRQDIEVASTHGDRRFAAVPWFTSRDGGVTNDGIGRRQCTREFKIEPLTLKQRELLGYAPRQRIPEKSIEVWIGISTDEIQRLKDAGNKWQVNRWPLIEKRMSRSDFLLWMERKGYPAPPKSSCIGCPFHTNEHWRSMRENDPASWSDAVEVDAMLRSQGPMKGMSALSFMHRSMKPLDQVDLSTAADRGQVEFGFIQECEGVCGN